VRFGPILPEAPLARRRWIEHLEAAGRFQWRADRGRALLAAARAAVIDRVRSRHPAWLGLETGALAQRVASACDIEAGEVAAALEAPARRGREFARTISLLERIRAAL
jgi:hypothetical protein